MRQVRFWAIAPFGLLTILGKPLLSPQLPYNQVVVSSGYTKISAQSEILVQESSSPEATPSPEDSPSPEMTPAPEATPSPEDSPSPETTPAPEATPSPEDGPSPETTPAPEATPSPETTPSTQESKVILQQEGTLSDGDLVLPSDESIYDEHTFEGSEGQVVTVTLESPNFDTYLAVFSPTGDLLGEHDDISQKNTNSQLIITLPVTGTYRVIVNSYDKTGRGKYTLQVVQSVQ